MSRGISGNRRLEVSRYAIDIWRCGSVLMSVRDRVLAGDTGRDAVYALANVARYSNQVLEYDVTMAGAESS